MVRNLFKTATSVNRALQRKSQAAFFFWVFDLDIAKFSFHLRENYWVVNEGGW